MSEITLREYVERLVAELDKRHVQRFDDMDRRLNQHFELNDIALGKAEKAISSRLDAMNEFREALKDQASRMATRVELETISTMLNDVRREKANLDGRLAMISGLISLGISVLVGLILRFIRQP